MDDGDEEKSVRVFVSAVDVDVDVDVGAMELWWSAVVPSSIWEWRGIMIQAEFITLSNKSLPLSRASADLPSEIEIS